MCDLKLIHTATPDTTQTGLFCRVWCGDVNRVGSIAGQVRALSRRSATAGRTPTQNAFLSKLRPCALPQRMLHVAQLLWRYLVNGSAVVNYGSHPVHFS